MIIIKRCHSRKNEIIFAISIMHMITNTTPLL